MEGSRNATVSRGTVCLKTFITGLMRQPVCQTCRDPPVLQERRDACTVVLNKQL